MKRRKNWREKNNKKQIFIFTLESWMYTYLVLNTPYGMCRSGQAISFAFSLKTLLFTKQFSVQIIIRRFFHFIFCLSFSHSSDEWKHSTELSERPKYNRVAFAPQFTDIVPMIYTHASHTRNTNPIDKVVRYATKLKRGKTHTIFFRILKRKKKRKKSFSLFKF